MLEPVAHAFNLAISTNPNGLPGKIIANAMGVALSTLHKWGEYDDVPLSRLVQFTTITRDPRPLAALARLCGYEIIPLTNHTRKDGDAQRRAIKEFADFLHVDAAGGARKRTHGEIASIEREGREAMIAIATEIEAARAQAGDA